MAIVKMSKLRLVGLGKEQNKILNALAGTSCAEIKLCGELEAIPAMSEKQKAPELLPNETEQRLESSIEILTKAVESYLKEHKQKCDFLAEGFDVDFNSFISAPSTEQEVLALCDRIDGLSAVKTEAIGEQIKLSARLKSLEPFLPVKQPFDHYKDTKYSKILLGSVPNDKFRALADYVAAADMAELSSFDASGEQTAVVVAAHRQVAEEVFGGLGALGFQKAPFYCDSTAEQLAEECRQKLEEYSKAQLQAEKDLFELGGEIKKIKILSDYYAFEREKQDWARSFPKTASTFVMEAYVPKEAQNEVSEALKNASEYAYFEYAEIDDDEMPPTLTKNNKVVRNFEFVTNMYTPPNYREFDPNGIMGLFFSIFMGFIMADIGYGLLMMAIGFGMAVKIKKDTGMRRLMMVVGIGGIFTVIFGFLFSSFFGFSSAPGPNNKYYIPFLPPPLIPDAQTSMSVMAGISLPTVLLIALGMGVVQLMASNLCKAYGCFRDGKIADGIFFGVVWAIFLIGLIMLVLGLIEGIGLGFMLLPGAITAVASVAIGAVTAGILEKGLGKFTKGFGAVYGIINYLSDILSYARLYGLMLSGAIIAQIASGQGWNLVATGNVAFIILGIIIMIIGHAFNLAMGVLGAYIHDARLQYIEFFSRFYGGEGELFKPLGSKRKYLSLTKSSSVKPVKVAADKV